MLKKAAAAGGTTGEAAAKDLRFAFFRAKNIVGARKAHELASHVLAKKWLMVDPTQKVSFILSAIRSYLKVWKRIGKDEKI